MGRSFDVNVDPLAQIIAPPVNETPEERRVREHEEANARKISEQIDEALKAEREEGKAKRKNRLKVLLLGQSESGALDFLFSSYRYPPWSSMRRRYFSLRLFRYANFKFCARIVPSPRPTQAISISSSSPRLPFGGVCVFTPMSSVIFLIG